MAKPRYTIPLSIRITGKMLQDLSKVNSDDRSDFIRDAIQEKLDKITKESNQ